MPQPYCMTNHTKILWLIRTIIFSSSCVCGLPDQGWAFLGLAPSCILFGPAATWSVFLMHWQKVRSISLSVLAYAYVASAQVPLTKQVIWLSSRSKCGEIHSISSGGNSSKVTWTEGVVRIGNPNVHCKRRGSKYPWPPGPGMASQTRKMLGSVAAGIF